MNRVLVLNVAGLTLNMLGRDAPHLTALAQQGTVRPLTTVTPAVTCSVQATFTTGSLPHEHGIVANGWYFRDLAEVFFWRQSNRLVEGEKIWDCARRLDPQFTCAKLFWWYNMHSTAEYSVTPRPVYLADGRKLPDIYTQPPGLREELNQCLGEFPLFQFWGPGADINSSQWIADCARIVYDRHKPTLTLVYLPHLDYNLQRLGPSHAAIRDDIRRIDAICGELIEHVQKKRTHVIVLSEYGVTEVSGPIHINRMLRESGHLAVREELGRELLNPGASEAFAVADHQIAHVYIKSPDRIPEVTRLLEGVTGIELVLDTDGKRRHGLDHSRSGELVALSQSDRWFTYYYWHDDSRAPDFSRTVDIHRKPGYDPVELFIDPCLRLPRFRIARRLLQKKLGFRMLMDVIGLDATLPKGSHGRVAKTPERSPLFITSDGNCLSSNPVAATDVKSLILRHVFGPQVPATNR
jgi:predicted AlkP superfamily pyrophosphatase or phosphodiesterase